MENEKLKITIKLKDCFTPEQWEQVETLSLEDQRKLIIDFYNKVLEVQNEFNKINMKKNSYQKQKDKIKELEKTIDVLINGTFDEKLIISKQYKILSSIEDMMWKTQPLVFDSICNIISFDNMGNNISCICGKNCYNKNK